MVHRWQNSPAFRPQGLTPSKVCDHDCFSHLLHFSASHTFFSDIVEKTYNKNSSLCINLKRLSFNSMCCLQHCEEHYLDRGVTDKKTGGLRIRKRGGAALWISRLRVNINLAQLSISFESLGPLPQHSNNL